MQHIADKIMEEADRILRPLSKEDYIEALKSLMFDVQMRLETAEEELEDSMSQDDEDYDDLSILP